MTWRPSDELFDRVRRAAERQRCSMNAYVSAVLHVATDPDLADSEAARLRERLDRAGLLAGNNERRKRPPADAVARARAAAGQGIPLSDLVARDR